MGILDRAKQGDAQAIATLLNRSLASRNVTALVRSRPNRLDIVIQGQEIPNQAEFMPLISRGMINLNIDYPVHLYARRLGEDTAAWKQVIGAKTAALAVDVNMGKLVSVQPTQYQDVIVRFSDRQGRIKCLTSLKELVQVIGHSSFSYPAIAQDPSLRLLLNNLAEFSTVDHQGRQVLTQASILCPGQSWQSVDIQISNHLSFLPTNQSPAINVQVTAADLSPQAEAFGRPAGSLLDEFGAALSSDPIPEPSSEVAQVQDSPAPSTDWLTEFGEAIATEQSPPAATFSRPAGSLLDEFGAAAEPSLEPAQPEPSPSSSFLDEFTAAIDANSNLELPAKPVLNPPVANLDLFADFPAPQKLPYSMDDLLAELQSVQP
ncbi:MAG: hypothetical protein SFT94_05660 [Pseudanabaenaceae cyanobacterium bins.68]|nr:hypothetical protein [Pseudanabaenaceae cyanobacterium bins.68]